MKPLLSIIGAGGHARVIADAARESGQWQDIQLFDTTWPREKNSGDWPIVGALEDFLSLPLSPSRQVIAGCGDNLQRQALQQKLESAACRIATVIHPHASISQGAVLAPGTVVMAGAVVGFGVRIGTACIINTRASVDHDCVLGQAVHISPGATLCGHVSVGQRSWVGAGAVVLQNRQIGADAMVGAGCTLLQDAADNSVMVGSPARALPRSPSD